MTTMTTTKPLVVLDVDGIFCYKRKDKSKVPSDGCIVIARKHYDIIVNPYIKDFVKKCTQKYDIGIFSSTKWFNIEPLLKHIFKNTKKYFKFIWCRDRTRLDPNYGKVDNVKKFDTIKMLKDIIEHPDINQDRDYGFHNIVLCDDSQIKTRYNPIQNILIVEPWIPGKPFDINSLLENIAEQFNILSNTEVTRCRCNSI